MISRRKLWLAIIIGAALLVGWYGVHQYNRPVAGLENTQADISIDATQLLASFKENEETANQKYLDKVIAVDGVVAQYNDDDEPTIQLMTGDPLSQVICKLRATKDKIKAKPGDQITIKGKCTGYLMDVLLVNSMIIQ